MAAQPSVFNEALGCGHFRTRFLPVSASVSLRHSIPWTNALQWGRHGGFMDERQRSGFWSTLPGILTGAAALITAATGGYLAFDRTPHKAAAATAAQSNAASEPKPAAASPSQTASPAEARSAALADSIPTGA